MLESQVMEALESIIYTTERMRGKMTNNILLLLWNNINFVDSKCNRDAPPLKKKYVKHPLRSRIKAPGIESGI